ncbi:unnamed protein product [Trichobilharzia szidati]|nr:unnamed protein product [Trichobilharzia szidati]
MGQILFTDVKNGIMYQPEEYGPYTEEHSLHQCVQEENDAYSAKLKTQEKLDCDVFRPSIHGGDPQNLEYNREFATLKSKIIDSYKQKYLYGKTICKFTLSPLWVLFTPYIRQHLFANKR